MNARTLDVARVARDAASIEMKVRISGVRRLRLRYWIGVRLLRLGAWLIARRVEVSVTFGEGEP